MNNCPYYKKCGSCAYALDNYENSLKKKKEVLKRLFPKVDIDLVACDDPYHYRHKVIFTFFENKERMINAGFYEEDSHRVIRIEDCLIQNEEANALIKDILDLARKFKLRAYREDRGTGLLRHVQIRTAHASRKLLVTFVLGDKVFPSSRNFINELRKLHPEIIGIVFNYNSRHTSVVLGETEKVVFGKNLLIDELGPFKFEIASKSFYQVNPMMALKIYEDAMSFAKIRKSDMVLDAYCGTGTISLFASQYAKAVVGVEINKYSIMAANRNKQSNHINNVNFVCSDVKEYMLANHFDVVITDPPRNGMSREFISTLLRTKPRTIVYVSCNPETMKRDLNGLASRYRVKQMRFYDQFAFTSHFESVALLEIKR